MKKTLTFMLVLLALGFASCHRNKTDKTQNDQPATDTVSVADMTVEAPEKETFPMLADADFLYVEKGDLFFYDVKTHKATRYPNEPDKVVDAVCTSKGMVYYNVISNNRLLLKRLNLNKTNPEPTVLLDWDVNDEKDLEFNYSPYGDLMLSQDETQIGLETDVIQFVFKYANIAVYDCITKTMNKYNLYSCDIDEGEFEDLKDESGFTPFKKRSNVDMSLFEDSDCLYYVGDGELTCLNDQLDEVEIVGPIVEEYGLDHDPIALDPTGARLLFCGIVVLGEGAFGYYGVSSLDGKEQQFISDLNEDGLDPEWLRDGSLLIPGYDSDPALFLMDAQGELRTVAHPVKFYMMH